MIRIGVIGCGFMGDTHLQAYKAIGEDNVKVVAIADVRKEKRDAAVALWGCTAYETGMELIEKADVDAIDICLPTYLHADHAIAAMKKGRNVFVEKPVAISVEQAEKMIATQKETGTQAMVGQVIRIWDEYKWLKEAKDSGEFGAVESAYFKRVSALPTWAWDGWLHKQELSGGVSVDMHIHDADFARFLLGEPTAINSVAARNKDGAITHIFTNYAFPGNVAVGIECSWDYPANFPFAAEYRVKFEKATVEYVGGKVTVYPKDGDVYNPTIEKACDMESDRGGNLSDLGGYYNELKYFIDTLNSGKPLTLAPIDEAAKSLDLVLKEVESAGGLIKK